MAFGIAVIQRSCHHPSSPWAGDEGCCEVGKAQYATGLVIARPERTALDQYLERLGTLTGSARPRTVMIHGWTFNPAAEALAAAPPDRCCPQR